MSSLKKVLLKKVEIEIENSFLKEYYKYFKDFEGKPDFKVKLKNYIYVDFYIREKIFEEIDNFLILHASSISDGENAFLIAGRTSVGKSLLTIFLSKNFFYTGDDISPCFLKDKVYLIPYPIPISIHKDFKKYLSDEEIIEERNFEKIFVFPKNIINDKFLPLKSFIFPIPSKINKFEVMDKRKSFLYLWGIFINRKKYVQKNGFSHLKRIVFEIPFYKIYYKDIDYLISNGNKIVRGI
jgi:hypothetical protein